MGGFSGRMVETPRLAMHVWTSGPEDGRPLLLVHGNITTGGFWRYVAEELPDDVRVIAPDLRSFGLTDAEPVDATRGVRDMVDDLRGLLETLGLADAAQVHAAGWSMGGAILEQYLIDHPGDLASVTLVAPVSPYGFGGTKGPEGTPCTDDFAGSGGGTAAPDFVRRLAARDRSTEDPASAPRVVLMTYFGPGSNAANVDEEFLVDELMTTTVGDDNYPGDAVPSDNWPNVGPGRRGILNSMSPKWFDTSGFADTDPKPPITWIRATDDQVVNDRSGFDFATLGELGAVPGWPGPDVMPPQPMVAQMRAVLEKYAAGGGSWREVVLDGVAHGIPLEAPGRVAEEIVATMNTR